jgi:TolA-binding protein
MKKAAFFVMVLFLVSAVPLAAAAQEDKEYRTALKHYNSKHYKEAARIFKEYVNRKPDPSAYYLIGYSLYELGKFKEAEENFQQAYLIDPEFSLEKAGLIRKK